MDFGLIRDGLKSLPQLAAHQASATTDLRSIYVVKGHSEALNPEREIVVGDRGVGKSFWASVLQNSASKTAIAPYFANYDLKNCEASIGFTETLGTDNYPSARVLKAFVDSNEDASSIWRAVIIHNVSRGLLPLGWNEMNWQNKANWISNNPEIEENILKNVNAKAKNDNRTHLVIFDALDRLAKDWKSIRILTRSLLEVVLDMRSFSNINCKIFIRPDMFLDKNIWNIRDGSKLKQNHVSLMWKPYDLYGYLWHWLLHEPSTKYKFASIVKEHLKIDITVTTGESIIDVPESLSENVHNQMLVFNLFAGSYMGSDKRRGTTYTWIPNHLADAKNNVSVRSFIVAIREAAKSTPPNSTLIINPTSIKKGVQLASQTRIEQLQEDYVWINDLLTPLAGLKSPSERNDFLDRWKKENTLNNLISQNDKDEDYLLPIEIDGLNKNNINDASYLLLIKALENINVILNRSDGRIDMPDLFRVGAGLLKRGGVRPI